MIYSIQKLDLTDDNMDYSVDIMYTIEYLNENLISSQAKPPKYETIYDLLPLERAALVIDHFVHLKQKGFLDYGEDEPNYGVCEAITQLVEQYIGFEALEEDIKKEIVKTFIVDLEFIGFDTKSVKNVFVSDSDRIAQRVRRFIKEGNHSCFHPPL